MNRLIVIAPFAVLLLVAIGVASFLSWKKIGSERERVALIDRRNKSLEESVHTLQDAYSVLSLSFDQGGFPDHKSMFDFVRDLHIDTEDVVVYMSTYEAQVNENLSYLPQGRFTYPVMVQVLGDRLRETEARLKIAEAKLREYAEEANATR